MTNLEQQVADFIEGQFNDWIGLACDDYDELQSYGLEEGDEKDYARERMQEAADDVSEFYDCYVDDEFIGYTKDEVVDAMKAYLRQQGYDVK